MAAAPYPEGLAVELFDAFVSAVTCRAALRSFKQLCDHLSLNPAVTERPLYRPIKHKLDYWRANGLWAKLDRRAGQKEYQHGAKDLTCVVIGAGPVGLRTAIELALLGYRVVLIEKRDSFSRNNVLHLWPFAIHDLRGLGAKRLYGRFCTGSIDHISIRQLQLVLLKVALLLGVELHVNVEFKNLLEPPEDQRTKVGWRMQVTPKSHVLNQLEFDVIIGADGRRNTLPGFRRKEFRGKLAIAITANFKNRNTAAEASVEEISGVAFIFNQRFFTELKTQTGIDLENIVYYKDDTHYFVMTAKKQSLLEKAVIKQDFSDTEQLLSRGNVDHNALQSYAREAANFSTNQRLRLDFAINHYGQPDAAMFDFTCMYASENAAMVKQRHGHALLVTLVGDSLLEPFWPMGTGIARGFLAALDSCWMIRSWAQGQPALEVLAERESVYRLLPQTTPENLQKNFSLFTIDPSTRYVNISSISPAQVRHLLDTGEEAGPKPACDDVTLGSSPSQLLSWCQEQTAGYRGVAVSDLTTSWRSGLALCALIHRFRPDAIDFSCLSHTSVEQNVSVALSVAQSVFGVCPLVSVEEVTSQSDPLSMVMYLSQFYQLLKDTAPPAGVSQLCTPASLLTRLGLSPSRRRNPKDHKEARAKRRRTSQQEQTESCDPVDDVSRDQLCDDVISVGGTNVKLLANQLQAKFDSTNSNSSSAALRKQQGELSSSVTPPTDSPETSSWKPRKRTFQQEQMSFRFKEKVKAQTGAETLLADQITNQMQEEVTSSPSLCLFCGLRVYLMERLSAEGLFFHRSCFTCFSCSSVLRLSAYAFDQSTGRFYCPQHYETRLLVRRKLTDGHTSTRTSSASLGVTPPLCVSPARRRSSAASLMSAAPERVELENTGDSSSRAETEPEEVSEETLNIYNLYLEPLNPMETLNRAKPDQAKLNRAKQDQRTHHRSSSEEEEGETGRGRHRELEGETGRGRHRELEGETGRGRHRVTSHSAKERWRDTLERHQRDRQAPDRQTDTPDRQAPDRQADRQAHTPDRQTHTPGRQADRQAHTPDSQADRQEGADTQADRQTDIQEGADRQADGADTPGEDSYQEDDDEDEDEDEDEAGSEAESSDDEEFSFGSTAATGSDIIDCETQLLADSVTMETAAEGRGSFDDITPEVPPRNRPLPPPAPRHQPEGEEAGARRGVAKEVEGGGARSLWRAVKEKKKKWGRSLPANHRRDAGGCLYLNEDSSLESLVLLQRCYIKPRNNLRLELADLSTDLQRCTIEEEVDRKQPAYVPHALAFKRAYAIKKRPPKPVPDDGRSSCPTELVGVMVEPSEASSLSVKETLFQPEGETGRETDRQTDRQTDRRVQRAARRKAKQEQLKRLHKAQMIQRQLQQVEEKQRQLEEKGVMVEKALRGEADYWEDDSQDVELHLGGLGKQDDPVLMQQWFQLVQQKNSLLRFESELMIYARELELEDRQSRLQQELRERMAVDDRLKQGSELLEERLILEEMLEVVEQRDRLVSLLEEQRRTDMNT